jgi:hypothetical protein
VFGFIAHVIAVVMSRVIMVGMVASGMAVTGMFVMVSTVVMIVPCMVLGNSVDLPRRPCH